MQEGGSEFGPAVAGLVAVPGGGGSETMTALLALTQAGTVLAGDPADRTPIAANRVGAMPWTECAQPISPLNQPWSHTLRTVRP